MSEIRKKINITSHTQDIVKKKEGNQYLMDQAVTGYETVTGKYLSEKLVQIRMRLWVDCDFKQRNENILQHLLEILHKILGSVDITATNGKQNNENSDVKDCMGGEKVIIICGREEKDEYGISHQLTTIKMMMSALMNYTIKITYYVLWRII